MQKTKKRSFSQLFENNIAVLIFSLVIAVILWCGVSMFETTEVEKTFTNVKIQMNYEGSLPDNNNLKIFSDQEYYMDVTVKGMSYLVNAESFSDSINASVSFASVTKPGTYSLPVNVSVENPAIEIVNYTKNSVSLYFDEYMEKTFTLEDEILELDGYVLPEGYTRENAQLSTQTVRLQGPALEMNKVAGVKAVVELNEELNATRSYTAEIVYVGTSENASFEHVSIKNEEPVNITIPVTYTAAYMPVVAFTNMPKDLRETGFAYTVYPSSVSMTVASEAGNADNDKMFTIGTIDFSQINNESNTFIFSAEDLDYEFDEAVTRFVVTIDMSAMHKRWLEVGVSTDGLKLPENAKLLTQSVQSVQIVGPGTSVDGLDTTECYAVPQMDGVKLQPGLNEVPVRIVLRTLTDSWVRGNYTVQIQVDE